MKIKVWFASFLAKKLRDYVQAARTLRIPYLEKYLGTVPYPFLSTELKRELEELETLIVDLDSIAAAKSNNEFQHAFTELGLTMQTQTDRRKLPILHEPSGSLGSLAGSKLLGEEDVKAADEQSNLDKSAPSIVLLTHKYIELFDEAPAFAVFNDVFSRHWLEFEVISLPVSKGWPNLVCLFIKTYFNCRIEIIQMNYFLHSEKYPREQFIPGNLQSWVMSKLEEIKKDDFKLMKEGDLTKFIDKCIADIGAMHISESLSLKMQSLFKCIEDGLNNLKGNLVVEHPPKDKREEKGEAETKRLQDRQSTAAVAPQTFVASKDRRSPALPVPPVSKTYAAPAAPAHPVAPSQVPVGPAAVAPSRALAGPAAPGAPVAPSQFPVAPASLAAPSLEARPMTILEILSIREPASIAPAHPPLIALGPPPLLFSTNERSPEGIERSPEGNVYLALSASSLGSQTTPLPEHPRRALEDDDELGDLPLAHVPARPA